ncbi:hypothetical protein HHI36_017749 [Cryptolaemus montrouzieri]|uniref:Vitellogenin n=1 Tax=Cryptolaemus montrouzieri TaxID=559131 RepID=A0ABD2NNQ0_9CUCU
MDICNSYGFCSSYKEAQWYRASAAFSGSSKIKLCTRVQFVHHKADFDVITFDGKETFHNLDSIQIKTILMMPNPIKHMKFNPSDSKITDQRNFPFQIHPASTRED